MNDLRRPLVREIQAIELALMRSVTDEPWLAPHDEASLRWALSLARVSVVVSAEETVDIGHATDDYRRKLHALIAPGVKGDKVLRAEVRSALNHIVNLARAEMRSLVQLFGGRLTTKSLARAIRSRPLALTMGGGGGTSYVFVGALTEFEEGGIEPSLITGTSMGAIVGAFRCRQREFSLADVSQLIGRLSWRRVFKPFATGSRFGLPATLKLHLRAVIGHEFERDGQFLRLKDLHVPLRVCVAGLTSGQSPAQIEKYAHLLDDAVADVGSFRTRAKSIARTLNEITKEPVKATYLGGDELTREFDVLDAIGFSSAVPGIIQYDVLRDDERMVELIQALMEREGILRFIDGGLADNLPAREAWRAIQDGAVAGQRDPFVLALDGFAPRLSTRHLLFLPLMRIAAENSKLGRKAAHLTIDFKKVLSPLTVVPTPDEFRRAVENGRREVRPLLPLIRKMIGPIPDPPGMLASGSGGTV